MSAPANSPQTGAEGLSVALGRVLGGTVRDLHRLSGGASRITSSFELLTDDGASQPLILQQDRGGGIAGPGRVRVEVALLRAAARAGVPVATVVALGENEADGLGPAWLVVERVGGETIPRKILRDPEWAEARTMLTAQCARALADIHAIDWRGIEGLAPVDPLRDPLPFLDALGRSTPSPRIRGAMARNPPPTRGPAGDRARRLPAGQSAGRPRRTARRPRLGAGPRRRSGRGPGVALRPGLAFRGYRSRRRLRRRGGLAGRLRGRRRRGDRPRAPLLVARLRHREVGHHLRHAGLVAPQRRHPFCRVGRHRPPGL